LGQRRGVDWVVLQHRLEGFERPVCVAKGRPHAADAQPEALLGLGEARLGGRHFGRHLGRRRRRLLRVQIGFPNRRRVLHLLHLLRLLLLL